MRRFIVLERLQQWGSRSRDPNTARHWLDEGSRNSRPLSNRMSIQTSSTVTRSQSTRATTSTTTTTPTTAVSPKAQGFSQRWKNDVTERTMTTAIPMTSHGEKAVNSEEETTENKLSQQSSQTRHPRPPPPSSQTTTTTTKPPYLDFDTARPFSKMPAPFSLPVIGTMWMHLPGGPLHGLTFEQKTARLQDIYGPIIRETVLLGFTMVHVYLPDDIEAVYRVQGAWPKREAFRMLRKYNTHYQDGVQGLLTSQGEEWHKLRSQAQVKMMKPKSASAYLHLHIDVGNDFVSTIDRLRGPDGVIEDLLPELYKFGMEGIGCVCFNRRLGALEADIPADSDTYRFIQAVSDVMDVTHNENKRLFILRHSPTFRKLVQAQGFIRKLSAQEAMQTLKTVSQRETEMDGESGDLIPYLMTKTQLTEQQVMTLISEFFFAGVDTTSHLLGFALYLLAKNPEAQEKLKQEIDRMVPEDDVISASTLGHMSYLKGVTKETCRMMPILPGNGRTLTKDVVLSGYHVPAGTFMGLHHDLAGKSAQYVKEPDRFEPERWVRGSTCALGDPTHPFIVMPFGFGPRSCVGRRFAEQEYSLALIKILQKFRVEYAHNEDLWCEVCVVNKPMTPLKFRFIPRK